MVLAAGWGFHDRDGNSKLNQGGNMFGIFSIKTSHLICRDEYLNGIVCEAIVKIG